MSSAAEDVPFCKLTVARAGRSKAGSLAGEDLRAPMGTLHALPAGCLHLQPLRPVLLVAHVPGNKRSREHAARLRCRASVAQEQAAPISRGCPEPVLREAVAFAPATVANLGPGFDWLGCAVEVRDLLRRAPIAALLAPRLACPDLASPQKL